MKGGIGARSPVSLITDKGWSMVAAMKGGNRVRGRRGWALVSGIALALLASGATALGLGFHARKDYPVSDDPFAVSVGDFNQDGRQDLAVARFEGPDVEVFKGLRHGKFKDLGSYVVDGNPIALAIGHFNKGRDPDLAVATNGAVSVLLGRAGMKFGDAHFYGDYGTSQARGIASADFNGDGNADLAVSNDANGGQLSVLLGDGHGAFGSQHDFAIGGGVAGVAAANLNQGKRPDVVVAGPEGAGEVSVLLATKGGPVLAPPKVYPAGPFPQELAVRRLQPRRAPRPRGHRHRPGQRKERRRDPPR